jgi:exopolysaccharide biosynthesis polyprenyl glycosylphosphotransferase
VNQRRRSDYDAVVAREDSERLAEQHELDIELDWDQDAENHACDRAAPALFRHLTPNELKRRLMVSDASALGVGLVVAFIVQAMLRPIPRFEQERQAILVLMSLPGFALGAGLSRLYHSRANERAAEEAANVLKAVGIGTGGILFIALAITYKDISRFFVLMTFACSAGLVLIERLVARRVFSRLRARGVLRRRVVIVGTDPHAIGILHRCARDPQLGYDVVGFVGDDDLGERSGARMLGRIDELDAILKDANAIGVIVSLGSVPSEQVNALARRLTDSGYHVTLSSSLNDIDITRIRPQLLGGETMIYVEPVIRNGWRAIAKRAFDIVLATTVLVLTLPITLVAIAAIKLDSQGPAFFRQTRVGKDGVLFTMIKLRTMDVDAEARKAELADQNEADGPLFKITYDPRITRVGRILRKFSIDELPQLWCVLQGTMSMVGPRPALTSEVAEWDDAVRERLRVPPGLTGLWQVSGRSDSSFEQYKRMDLFYVDNWSLLHDLSICAKTVGVVLTGQGAS